MELTPYRRKAHFYETDAMSIVHHSNYIRWFEEARVHFMDQIGYSYHRTMEMGVDIAVLEVCCQYKAMVYYDDTVDVHVFLKQLSPVKMTVGYEIKSAADCSLKTTGESTHCFLDRSTHGIVRLNKTVPELYEALGAHL